ncbi:hypothetical protein E4T39_04844 [Aureobasidium subglaciale]|nr:hypothetical protein E4T39_04844 [Aureobasidium subglaciale]
MHIICEDGEFAVHQACSTLRHTRGISSRLWLVSWKSTTPRRSDTSVVEGEGDEFSHFGKKDFRDTRILIGAIHQCLSGGGTNQSASAPLVFIRILTRHQFFSKTIASTLIGASRRLSLRLCTLASLLQLLTVTSAWRTDYHLDTKSLPLSPSYLGIPITVICQVGLGNPHIALSFRPSSLGRISYLSM